LPKRDRVPFIHRGFLPASRGMLNRRFHAMGNLRCAVWRSMARNFKTFTSPFVIDGNFLLGNRILLTIPIVFDPDAIAQTYLYVVSASERLTWEIE